MISDARRIQLNALIQAGKAHDFYSWPEWDKLRRKVMKLDNYECQRCKGMHRHRRAVVVHHVKHLKDRPDLALSMYDGDDRQLVSVCKRCHEELHPESQRQFKKIVAPLTLERWD